MSHYHVGSATPAVKDSSESLTIVEGNLLTRVGVSDSVSLGLGERQPVAVCEPGQAFFGVAFASPDLTDGLAAVHSGIVKVVDSTSTTITIDAPLKAGAAGTVDLWVTVTDAADLIIGYAHTLPGVVPGEANALFMRLGVR